MITMKKIIEYCVSTHVQTIVMKELDCTRKLQPIEQYDTNIFKLLDSIEPSNLPKKVVYNKLALRQSQLFYYFLWTDKNAI